MQARCVRTNRTHAAFTLIEILTVISIILILAAILFPVFSHVREKARQTSCINNQRQLGIAMTMYTQDSSGFFPPVTDAAPWPTFLTNYLPSGAIFQCPSSSNEKADSANPDYGFNSFLCKRFTTKWASQPSEVMIIADAVNTPLLKTYDDIDFQRHQKIGIACFADGHAAAVRSSDCGLTVFLKYQDITDQLWKNDMLSPWSAPVDGVTLTVAKESITLDAAKPAGGRGILLDGDADTDGIQPILDGSICIKVGIPTGRTNVTGTPGNARLQSFLFCSSASFSSTTPPANEILGGLWVNGCGKAGAVGWTASLSMGSGTDVVDTPIDDALPDTVSAQCIATIGISPVKSYASCAIDGKMSSIIKDGSTNGPVRGLWIGNQQTASGCMVFEDIHIIATNP